MLGRSGSSRAAAVDPEPSAVDRSSDLQAETLLKWQQESLCRLIRVSCLARDGLVPRHEALDFKALVLRITVDLDPNPNVYNDSPQLTRAKLLFLQDLLYSGCINEREYHDAKNALILRLASQGATIDTDDFLFDTTTYHEQIYHNKTRARQEQSRTELGQKTSEPIIIRQSPNVITEEGKLREWLSSTPRQARGVLSSSADLDTGRGHDGVKPPPSPFRQVMGTLSRLSKSPSRSKSSSRSYRSKSSHCPGRNLPPPLDPPPLPPHRYDHRHRHRHHDSNSADDSMPRKLLDPNPGLRPESFRDSSAGSDSDDADGGVDPANRGVDYVDDDDDDDDDVNCERSTLVYKRGSDSAYGSPRRRRYLPSDDHGDAIETDDEHGMKRDIVGNKPSRSTALGDNVRSELSRIRANMTTLQRRRQQQHGHLFTDEQIDAIAARLPADETELRKLFPRAWCERYGDVVLEVVRREVGRGGGGGGSGQTERARRAPSSSPPPPRASSAVMQQRQHGEAFDIDYADDAAHGLQQKKNPRIRRFTPPPRRRPHAAAEPPLTPRLLGYG